MKASKAKSEKKVKEEAGSSTKESHVPAQPARSIEGKSPQRQVFFHLFNTGCSTSCYLAALRHDATTRYEKGTH